MNSWGDRSPWVLNGIQRAVWFSQELAGDIGIYNILIKISMKGDLVIPIMERVLQGVDRDCPALRVEIWFDGNDLQGAVRNSVAPPLRVEQVGIGLPNLDAVIAEAGARAIDISSGRLWNYVLLEIQDLESKTDEEYVLLLNFHHIAVDGASVVLILERIFADYCYFMGEEFSYAPSMREFCHSLPGAPSDLIFWRKMLEGAPRPVLLPGQLNSPMFGDFTGFAKRLTLPGVSLRELRMLAASNGVTVQTVVFSCVVRALSILTESEDLLIGILLSRRTADVPPDAIGQFSGAFPVRINVKDATMPSDFLERTASCMNGVLQHPRVDPDTIFNMLRNDHSDRGGPGFQVVFAWDERPSNPNLPGLDTAWRVEFNGWCEWGLTLELSGSDDCISGQYFGRKESLVNVNLLEFTERITRCSHDLLEELSGVEMPSEG